MARTKKEAKNFACKFDKEIFEKLEEFCKLSGMNETTVVERAVENIWKRIWRRCGSLASSFDAGSVIILCFR